MESSHEVKKTHGSGLEVATQSEDSIHKVMCNFPDGTIGVFEIYYRASIFGFGRSYYSGELKILQSNPWAFYYPGRYSTSPKQSTNFKSIYIL